MRLGARDQGPSKRMCEMRGVYQGPSQMVCEIGRHEPESQPEGMCGWGCMTRVLAASPAENKAQG